MRITITAVSLAAFLVFPAQVARGGPVSGAAFPSELHGVWDAYPWPCVAGEQSDSDTRFLIEGRMRRNYEDDDTLVSIEEIAADPRAWRVSSTSSLDPDRSRTEARIYVLAGDRLTVADGGRTEVYIRCE